MLKFVLMKSFVGSLVLFIGFQALAASMSSGAAPTINAVNVMIETSSVIKPFKDWKSEKIQQIQSRVQAYRTQVDALKAKKAQEVSAAHKHPEIRAKLTPGLDQSIQYYEKQVDEEQWNLEVAQDLSITDYVALYLALQPVKNRFQLAASQMAPADIAELLEAYSANLGVQAPVETLANINTYQVPIKNQSPSAGKTLPTATNQRGSN